MSANDRNAEHNRRVIVEVGQMFSDVFTGIVEEADRSIKHGSELTGAPGQPVDTSYLLNSWQTVYESPSSAIIGTNTEYAESIEDGIQAPYTKKNGTQVTPRPITFGAHGGGAFSVRLTAAGIQRIKAAVVQRVNAARGKA